MPTPSISNVVVTVHGGTGLTVNWQTRDARFHFWLYRGATEYTDQTLYKNPLVERPRERTPNETLKAMGWFETRKLDGTKDANAVMIAQVMNVVRRGDMIANAMAEAALKTGAEEKARDERGARLAHARNIFQTMQHMIDNGASVLTLTNNDCRALLEYAPKE